MVSRISVAIVHLEADDEFLLSSASSTKVLLDGQTPAEYDPSLQNSRVKSRIVKAVKLKKHASGLSLPGMAHIASFHRSTHNVLM